eukprot:gene10188-10348_t
MGAFAGGKNDVKRVKSGTSMPKVCKAAGRTATPASLLQLRQQSSPFPRRRQSGGSQSGAATGGGLGGGGMSPTNSLTGHLVLDSAKESFQHDSIPGAELTSLSTAAAQASDWKAREQVLTWLEEGFKRAKGITKELRSHLSLVESAGKADIYCTIIMPLPGGEEEARVAFRCVRRLLDLFRDMKERCRHVQGGGMS